MTILLPTSLSLHSRWHGPDKKRLRVISLMLLWITPNPPSLTPWWTLGHVNQQQLNKSSRMRDEVSFWNSYNSLPSRHALGITNLMADGYIAKDIKNESLVVWAWMTRQGGRITGDTKNDRLTVTSYFLTILLFLLSCVPWHIGQLSYFNIAKKSLQFKFWDAIGESHRDMSSARLDCGARNWDGRVENGIKARGAKTTITILRLHCRLPLP